MGGQDAFENLHDALAREVNEETGVKIIIDQLFLIREYIGKNHEFTENDKDLHFVEFMFLCRALDDQVKTTFPDANQVAVEWIKYSELKSINLFPNVLREILFSYLVNKASPPKIYLGDVN